MKGLIAAGKVVAILDTDVAMKKVVIAFLRNSAVLTDMALNAKKIKNVVRETAEEQIFAAEKMSFVVEMVVAKYQGKIVAEMEQDMATLRSAIGRIVKNVALEVLLQFVVLIRNVVTLLVEAEEELENLLRLFAAINLVGVVLTKTVATQADHAAMDNAVKMEKPVLVKKLQYGRMEDGNTNVAAQEVAQEQIFAQLVG